jgi:hypothetical protein
MNDREKRRLKKKQRRDRRVAARHRPSASGPSPPTNLDELDTALDRIVDGFLVAQPPSALYHYTTWVAFESIITAASFRATAHHCTNDPGELISADSAALAAARHVLRELSGDESRLLRHFLADYENKKWPKLQTSYLSCFTEVQDDESQWGTYGARGAGVCFGLKTLRDETFEDDQFDHGFFKVGYSALTRESELRDKFRVVAHLYRGFIRRQPSRELGARRLGWNALMRLASLAAMSTKTPRWAHEQEWRHIVFPRHDRPIQPVRLEGSEYHLVPMRTQGRPLALSEVIVGPNQSFAPTREKVEIFLRSAGYGDGTLEMPAIVQSELPPRRS